MTPDELLELIEELKNQQLSAKSTRFSVDFGEELKSIEKHKTRMGKVRLKILMNQIYVPKLKASFQSPYLYHYPSASYASSLGGLKAKIKDCSTILGVDCSSTKTEVCLVNSQGEVVFTARETNEPTADSLEVLARKKE